MLIDHLGAVFFPEVRLFRLVGRISFPIFCFLIAQGAVHTKNIGKYLVRLTVFAFISEIPFDLVLNRKIFYYGSQNVFFTLALGLAAIALIKQMGKKWYFSVVTSAVCMVVAYLLKMDYSWYGVLMIIGFYLCRKSKFMQAGTIFLSTELYCLYRMIKKSADFAYFTTLIQHSAIFSIIPICLYNGEKGYDAKWVKWVFYLFYPVHLIIFAIIKSL